MTIRVDPYILIESCQSWKSDLKGLPRIFLIDIYSFLIERSSYYTHEKFRAHKSLEAYTMVVSGWVLNVKFLEIDSQILLTSEVNTSEYIKRCVMSRYIMYTSFCIGERLNETQHA